MMLPTTTALKPMLSPLWWLEDSKRWLFLLAGGMAFLTACSMFIQYGLGAIPCQMCWWQRYMHWSIGIIAMAAAGLPPKFHKPAALLILACAGTGFYVATWQFLAQQGILHFPPSCSSEGKTLSDAINLLEDLGKNRTIPCDKENFHLFGLTLATWNMPIMLGTVGLSLLALFHRSPSK